MTSPRSKNKTTKNVSHEGVEWVTDVLTIYGFPFAGVLSITDRLQDVLKDFILKYFF